MYALLVAATDKEMGRLPDLIGNSLPVVPLVTGIGIVNASYSLTKSIMNRRPDLVIHIGLCGSFRADLPIGDIVYIHTDIFGDMGATTSDGRFLSLAEMGFPLIERPDGRVYNSIENGNKVDDFFDPCPHVRACSSVTVNRVTGDPSSIELLSRVWNADCETMEGAAVALVCHAESIPYFQFRSVSNHVEPRDTTRWNIPLACDTLHTFCRQLIQGLKP